MLAPMPIINPAAADRADNVLGMTCNLQRGVTPLDKAWAVEYVLEHYVGTDPYVLDPAVLACHMETIAHIMATPER